MSDEIQSPLESQARLKSNKAVLNKLGPLMMLDHFKDDLDFTDFETPTFDHYED
jgi:hypothetical protein